ncbi:MAG: N-acetylglucosamine-6-phosphate deacetylase [Spirochaetia bacterium]
MTQRSSRRRDKRSSARANADPADRTTDVGAETDSDAGVSAETSRLVDLQVNGYLGVDFSSPAVTLDEIIQACADLIDHGVDRFCPTVITSSVETYRRNLPLIARVISLPELNEHILGIHAEGPFISARTGAVGAHDQELVRPPSQDFFDRMQEWADGTIVILTLAADQPGAAELCRNVAGSGVSVFLGHHEATSDDLRRLAGAGAVAITHLGNGMPNQVNRHRNPLLAGLAVDELSATIITDGHHLADELIKVIIRAKGAERLAVVSDASPLAGMAPGEYHASGNRVRLEESGLLHNPDKQCLVGSSATMVECCRYLRELGLAGDEELRRMVCDNPLRLLGGQS